MACHSREELSLPGTFPAVHSSLLPLPRTFPGLNGRPEVQNQNLQQWGSHPAACLQGLCYIPPGSHFQQLTPSCGDAGWTPGFLQIGIICDSRIAVQCEQHNWDPTEALRAVPVSPGHCPALEEVLGSTSIHRAGAS